MAASRSDAAAASRPTSTSRSVEPTKATSAPGRQDLGQRVVGRRGLELHDGERRARSVARRQVVGQRQRAVGGLGMREADAARAAGRVAERLAQRARLAGRAHGRELDPGGAGLEQAVGLAAVERRDAHQRRQAGGAQRANERAGLAVRELGVLAVDDREVESGAREHLAGVGRRGASRTCRRASRPRPAAHEASPIRSRRIPVRA